ncbi:MAG: retropepsin-like domain-containing protein [Deltaproteobacteria bacterium]|nr:retropepsin-like domain-containing protein [Deltaproteobacteria bacterium]
MSVDVFVPPAIAALRGKRDKFSGWALIDTGASMTCISPEVTKALGLQTIAVVDCHTPAGEVKRPVKAVEFEFPGSQIRVTTAQVIEVELAAPGIVMLVGRDLLAHAALTYDGPTGTWTLELPRISAPGFPGSLPFTGHGRAPVMGHGGKMSSTVRERDHDARKHAKKARQKSRGR